MIEKCTLTQEHASHSWLSLRFKVECPGIAPRPVMMHPLDYRKPNGDFEAAYCNDDACCTASKVKGFTMLRTVFRIYDEAIAHARETNHSMDFTYMAIYSARAS